MPPTQLATGEIIATAPAQSCYSSQLVSLGGEWFLLGNLTDYEGRTAFSDPVPVTADETGVHVVGI